MKLRNLLLALLVSRSNFKMLLSARMFPITNSKQSKDTLKMKHLNLQQKDKTNRDLDQPLMCSTCGFKNGLSQPKQLIISLKKSEKLINWRHKSSKFKSFSNGNTKIQAMNLKLTLKNPTNSITCIKK
jgi:hypothetical protein